MDYLALAGGLVLGKEDPGNVSEGFEQLLEVVLLGTLTQVAHPENIERSQIEKVLSSSWRSFSWALSLWLLTLKI
jgi:hypothetical protein